MYRLQELSLDPKLTQGEAGCSLSKVAESPLMYLYLNSHDQMVEETGIPRKAVLEN